MTDVLNGVETIATIVNWNHTWGFARRDGSIDNVFLHKADRVDDPPFAPGTRVKFRMVTTLKGPRGLGVEIVR
jgi:cold shock CspA family protein